MALKYPVSDVAKVWFKRLSRAQKQEVAKTANQSFSWVCRIMSGKQEMNYFLAFAIVSLTQGAMQLRDICPALDGGLFLEATKFKLS